MTSPAGRHVRAATDIATVRMTVPGGRHRVPGYVALPSVGATIRGVLPDPHCGSTAPAVIPGGHR